MTKVFVSGSRMVSRLPQEVTTRLQNMIDRGHEVLTGDANGVDKAVQRYFCDKRYEEVTIYHVGEQPRNNVGAWRSISVEVSGRLKGRDLYTQKDRRMAEVADAGLIIWDGKSSGSVQNMIWLINNHKSALVYLAPAKSFSTLRNRAELSELLQRIDSGDLKEIDRKIGVSRYIADDGQTSQGSLAF